MDKRKSSLEVYYHYIGSDSEKARAAILKAPYQKDGFLLCCIALTYRDEAMFFKNGRTRKTLVTEKIGLAKKYIDKAFRLSPLCRDVLFIKGTIYNLLNDSTTAIDSFISILKGGEDNSGQYNCSESDDAYIKMVVNDARFQLYRLFHGINEVKLGNKFLKEYRIHLKAGTNTIYKPLKNFLVK